MLFDVQANCSAEDLADSARTAVALDAMVSEHQLGSMAYYYKGTGVKKNEDAIASIILGTSQLTGHDGPGHIAIAEGKTKVRPLKVYHGKVGSGVSVEMAVKHGPVTLLSVIEQPGGKLALVVAEGESVAGPILEIGNTNSRYRFPCGAREFVNRWNSSGPAHHCAVGVGHLAHKIDKLGKLLGIEVIQVR